MLPAGSWRIEGMNIGTWQCDDDLYLDEMNARRRDLAVLITSLWKRVFQRRPTVAKLLSVTDPQAILSRPAKTRAKLALPTRYPLEISLRRSQRFTSAIFRNPYDLIALFSVMCNHRTYPARGLDLDHAFSYLASIAGYMYAVLLTCAAFSPISIIR